MNVIPFPGTSSQPSIPEIDWGPGEDETWYAEVGPFCLIIETSRLADWFWWSVQAPTLEHLDFVHLGTAPTLDDAKSMASSYCSSDQFLAPPA